MKKQGKSTLSQVCVIQVEIFSNMVDNITKCWSKELSLHVYNFFVIIENDVKFPCIVMFDIWIVEF